MLYMIFRTIITLGPLRGSKRPPEVAESDLIDERAADAPADTWHVKAISAQPPPPQPSH